MAKGQVRPDKRSVRAAASAKKAQADNSRIALAKIRWLRAYRKGMTYAEACRAAKIGRSTFYRWQELDEDFRAEIKAAFDASTEALEKVVYERAMKRSDILAMFILKKRKPEYRDRWEGHLTQDISSKMIDPASLKHMPTEDIEAGMKIFRRMLGEKEDG